MKPLDDEQMSRSIYEQKQAELKGAHAERDLIAWWILTRVRDDPALSWETRQMLVEMSKQIAADVPRRERDKARRAPTQRSSSDPAEVNPWRLSEEAAASWAEFNVTAEQRTEQRLAKEYQDRYGNGVEH